MGKIKYDKRCNYYEIMGTDGILKQKKDKTGREPVYVLKENSWELIERSVWVKLRLSWMTPAMAAKRLAKIA